MILPDGTILHPWWRKAGHTLSLPDIQETIATAPDILVIGTGSPGMMQPEQTHPANSKAEALQPRQVFVVNMLQRAECRFNMCF